MIDSDMSWVVVQKTDRRIRRSRKIIMQIEAHVIGSGPHSPDVSSVKTTGGNSTLYK